MFNKKDFIYRKRSAYSQEGCDHAIKFFEKRVDLHEVGTAGNKVKLDWKKSTDIFLKRNQYTLFEDVVQSCIKDYIKKYPTSDSLHRWDIFEIMKLQRYKPGEGYFHEHCENSGVDNMNRVLAWMIYLNDIADGGGTEFLQQETIIEPVAGNLYIWPAGPTHMHRGVVSNSEKKYFLTGWYIYS